MALGDHGLKGTAFFFLCLVTLGSTTSFPAAAQNSGPPVAVDVFAATPINTASSPQSALVILEASDDETLADALSYSIVSGPGKGSLSDPENGDAAISTGDITGRRVTYTPNRNVTGTDSFSYRVSDGENTSAVRTALVTVFRVYRDSAKQIGEDIEGGVRGDGTGDSIALSRDGQILAVGAQFHDGANGDEGRVRIYRRNGDLWSQLGVDIDGEAIFDRSGYSVALSSDGQTVAIGAVSNDEKGFQAGHVRIYDWNGSAWEQRGNDIDGEAATDQSGFSVALSSDGETVAIGAPGADGIAANLGHVRVYRWEAGTWNQRGNDIDGEAQLDRSGWSVALSSDGEIVAIGSLASGSTGQFSGQVRIYLWNGSAWEQLGDAIDGEASGDFAGQSVDLSSDGYTVAIGARGNDNAGQSAGHARVFRWSGTAWEQMGSAIDGEAEFDDSGFAVSLSSNGETLAVGAPFNDDGGSDAGHVRIYYWSGNAWILLGSSIDGEAVGDFAGSAVALSGDGQTVAIGVPIDDARVNKRGRVRIFSLSNIPPTVEDVFSATVGNAGNNPQTARVVLEGTDVEDDPISYRVITGPEQGLLYDPDNSDATVTTGVISGPRIDYQPDAGFYGTDTFTYRVNDGLSNSPVRTAEVAVFDDYRNIPQQLGADILGQAPGDRSGRTIALSSDGTIMAIGATTNDGGVSNGGQVRVYERSGTNWSQLGNDINGVGSNDELGQSVALSADGRTLIAGAPSLARDEPTYAQVFRFTGGDWEAQGEPIASEANGDEFGYDVAISSDGDVVAISGIRNDSNGSNSGHVRAYRWSGTVWRALGEEIIGEAANDLAGFALDLSSDGRVLAMSSLFNAAGGANAGNVRVYEWSGSGWTQLGTTINGGSGDQFGSALALSRDGHTLAVGARTDGAGSASVFRYDGSQWVAQGSSLGGEGASDEFGWSIDLSANAHILAVGARKNDGGGTDAGHVRLFQWDGHNWSQFASDIDGAEGDQSGWSIALSADGRAVAVGTLFASAEAGRVRVFNLANFAPTIANAPPASVGNSLNFSFEMQATDADPGDVLEWSITHNPGWLSINATTGVLSGSPENENEGTSTGIHVMVSDSTSTQDFINFDLIVPDADGDGLIDGRDSCDGTPGSETNLIDSSGCGPSERDTDGDGVNDSVDAFPEDPTEQLDSDGDGFGDNTELDAGSDPNDAADIPPTAGLPVWLLFGASQQ